jgi:signal transduction histidine kinase
VRLLEATYAEAVHQQLETIRARVSAACARAGLPDYPWWIPMVMNGLAICAGLIAVVQRTGDDSLLPVAGLMAIALAPWVFELVSRPVPWALHTLVTGTAATATALLDPVDYDFALFVLVMLAGHLGAVAKPARGLLATVVLAGTVHVGGLAGEGLAGSAFWVVALLVGWDVGFVMQYQQRRLTEEQRAQADHEATAVLEERQRIAREVHDVIAHSLSVTMLHLTAARRSLEEDGQVGVEEAVDALRDAERQGRQAMADIRHTVGLLGQQPAPATAAPDLGDVPALVDEFRAAGLDVALELHGDGSRLPATAGLGIYRIVQESLANIAKHQPREPAAVHLDVEGRQVHLVVWNEVAPRASRLPGGSGLKGMRERAELLGASFSAGPRDDRWVVEVSLPAADRPGRRVLSCPLVARSRPAMGPA